jgi:hypothetical protein
VRRYVAKAKGRRQILPIEVMVSQAGLPEMVGSRRAQKWALMRRFPTPRRPVARG